VVVNENEVCHGGFEFGVNVAITLIVSSKVRADAGRDAAAFGRIPGGVHRLDDDLGIGMVFLDAPDHLPEVGLAFLNGDFGGRFLVLAPAGVVHREFDEYGVGVLVDDFGLEDIDADTGGFAGLAAVDDRDLGRAGGGEFVEPGVQRLDPAVSGAIAGSEAGAVHDNRLVFSGTEVVNELRGRAGVRCKRGERGNCSQR
jgi:hypothetical protein